VYGGDSTSRLYGSSDAGAVAIVASPAAIDPHLASARIGEDWRVSIALKNPGNLARRVIESCLDLG